MQQRRLQPQQCARLQLGSRRSLPFYLGCFRLHHILRARIRRGGAAGICTLWSPDATAAAHASQAIIIKETNTVVRRRCATAMRSSSSPSSRPSGVARSWPPTQVRRQVCSLPLSSSSWDGNPCSTRSCVPFPAPPSFLWLFGMRHCMPICCSTISIPLHLSHYLKTNQATAFPPGMFLWSELSSLLTILPSRVPPPQVLPPVMSSWSALDRVTLACSP